MDDCITYGVRGTGGNSTAVAAAAAVLEKWQPLLLSASYQRQYHVHAAAPSGISELRNEQRKTLVRLLFTMPLTLTVVQGMVINCTHSCKSCYVTQNGKSTFYTQNIQKAASPC